jgi:hypothetical protein
MFSRFLRLFFILFLMGETTSGSDVANTTKYQRVMNYLSTSGSSVVNTINDQRVMDDQLVRCSERNDQCVMDHQRIIVFTYRTRWSSIAFTAPNPLVCSFEPVGK